MQVLVDDGKSVVFLVKGWLEKEDADKLLEQCQTLETKLYPFGYRLNRKLFLMGDKNLKDQIHSGQEIKAHEWATDDFKHVRDRLHDELELKGLNGCLVNHYVDGKQGVSDHSDTELSADHKSVFTISLGATRTFRLTEQSTKNKIEFQVEHGDLLAFQKETQRYWKHGIPAEPHVKDARYSLTIRGMKTK